MNLDKINYNYITNKDIKKIVSYLMGWHGRKFAKNINKI